MVKLIVEGEGGKDNQVLQVDARKAFHKLLEKAGFKGRMPSIIAAGDRSAAYDRYKTLVKQKEKAVLLIDSKKTITAKFSEKPWDFLKSFEHWYWEADLDNATCHLMVQCMEAWFYAYKDCLVEYYGHDFRVKSLSSRPIEKIEKDECISSLNQAASQCKTKKGYDKGRDSFKILMGLSPDKLKKASPWAERFFNELDRIL